jgi:predicted nuclease of predicted toxin-antitoxin system
MRLLLDEQINPAVARQLRKRGHDVVTPQDLGTRGARDPEQLRAAAAARRALVTYNIPDYRRLLFEWHQRGLSHWGIIFVSEKTIPQRNPGQLVRALHRLLGEHPARDALRDQALFLTARESRRPR